MRTPNQKVQWARYNLLGTLVGLDRWILSKLSVILSTKDLSIARKDSIARFAESLCAELRDAATDLGWKPKGPSNGQ